MSTIPQVTGVVEVGTGEGVGGIGVSVGGTGVAVGIGVGVGTGVEGEPQATVIVRNTHKVIIRNSQVFLRILSPLL